MAADIAQELAALGQMTVRQLRERYVELFAETTTTGHKAWLVKRIAWRVQALREGGLSQRARQRADELARDADLRLSPPSSGPQAAKLLPPANSGSPREPRLPPVGTTINRRYKGQTVAVMVEAQGFRFDGELYHSLSAVANDITGSHVNGFQFFRLSSGRRKS
jgi:Protein of unknown function (DUF2924)